MCEGLLGEPSLIQRLSVSVRVRYFPHFSEWVGGGVWRQLDLQEPSLSLFDQHSDGVVWQAAGEPRFCAANNVFVLPNKVSARGSTCSSIGSDPPLSKHSPASFEETGNVEA